MTCAQCGHWSNKVFWFNGTAYCEEHGQETAAKARQAWERAMGELRGGA
jgi:hypothetical protein